MKIILNKINKFIQIIQLFNKLYIHKFYKICSRQIYKKRIKFEYKKNLEYFNE